MLFIVQIKTMFKKITINLPRTIETHFHAVQQNLSKIYGDLK